jgi:hypothetical protein
MQRVHSGRKPGFTRREILRGAGAGLISLPFWRLDATAIAKRRFREPKRIPYKGSDDQLMEEIERAAFDFFWNEASSTGQVKDRALLNVRDSHTLSSIAATGFGLTGLCIGDARRYRRSDEIVERVRRTLRFLWERMPHEHGFYYHFVDMESGQRMWRSELSSIDTSILICGVLTARAYFHDDEIQDLATKLYERVDWQWMFNGGPTLCMGWHPESGFLNARWVSYCELMMIYLLAIGSPTYPLSPRIWAAWKRPQIDFEGYQYISGRDPLFTHQYSQAWFDFRGLEDRYTNYFQNSIIASGFGGSARRIRHTATQSGEDLRGKAGSTGAWCPARRAGRCPFFFPNAWRFCEISANAMEGPGETMDLQMPLIP